MEIGLREWLVIGSILVMALVIFDGWRRMRRLGKGQIRLDIDKTLRDSSDNTEEASSHFNPELPNGGARVKGDPLFSDYKPHIEPTFDQDEGILRPKKAALSSAITKPAESLSTVLKPSPELQTGSLDETLDDNKQKPSKVEAVEASVSLKSNPPEIEIAEEVSTNAAKTSTKEEIKEPLLEPVETQEVEAISEVEPAKFEKTQRAAGSLTDLNPNKVLLITAVASRESPYLMKTLNRLVTACGLEFGDMDIYHRFEDVEEHSPVQFSMANANDTGSFDLQAGSDQPIQGVTFFMSLESPKDIMNAYECMLATAEALVKNFGGELLDDHHSVMRPQTKEHYRERIRDFEMQILPKKIS